MQLLEVILQQQLASDEAAVINTLNLLSVITPSVLSSSTSQRLWIARINTLLERPKHYGARWAGLCLAHRTALLNRELLVGSAQTWISFALPLLSRDEPIPTMVSAIHLLVLLYTSVKDMPEFHRQVISPTLQKFSMALLQLVEKPESPRGLKILIMHSLCVLIHEHPTLHIALQSRLHSMTLAHLSGAFPSISDPSLVEAAADVHSVLHLTGGKVRAGAVWRKSVDSAVTSARICLHELTSASRPASSRINDVGFDLPPLPSDDFFQCISLAMDRLKCLITLLVALLRCPASRPITLPIGSLADFAIHMISVSSNGSENPNHEKFIAEQRRILEASVVPSILEAGCDLICALSECARHLLTPHVPQLASVIAFHLEQPLPPPHRLPFLRVLRGLLSNVHQHPLHSASTVSRILKSLIPRLSRLLSQTPPSTSAKNQDVKMNGDGKSNKGKKKSRGYEGDEIFRSSPGLLLNGEAEEQELLGTLEALPALLSSPYINGPLLSVTSRLLISILLTLRQIPATAVSPNPDIHALIVEKVTSICEASILHDPGNPWLRRGLGLLAHIIEQTAAGGAQSEQALKTLDLLFHPHLPLTLRGIPQMDNIPLFRAEDKDERESREALDLVSLGTTDPALTPPIPPVNHRLAEDKDPVATAPPSAGAPVAQPLTSTTIPSVFSLNMTMHSSASTVMPPVTTPMATSIMNSDVTTDSHFMVPPALPASPAKGKDTTPGWAETRLKSTNLIPQVGDEGSDDDEQMPEIDMRSDSD